MSDEPEIMACGIFAADHIALTYTTHPSPPPDIASRIETRWNEYTLAATREGRTLFNSPVACLKSAAVIDGVLQLQLAKTDYKTFLVTNLRDRECFRLNSPAAITPALGNSILLTHGNTAYLGVRSKAVAAYPHWAHLFGGVLDWPAHTHGGAAVLLEHLYRELQEELGINADYLTAPPQVLALMRDPVLAQPELVWHGELSQPLQVHGEALNAQEHDTILAVPMAATAMDAPPRTPVSAAAIDMARHLTGHR
jgi:hypothetical protein